MRTGYGNSPPDHTKDRPKASKQTKELDRVAIYDSFAFIHYSTFEKMITQAHRNSHVLTVKKGVKLLLISDLHWDNPKCDRKALKRHLDYAVKEGAVIMVNGDFFCLMQGKYDPRGNKKDILPEHNKANYIDAVIEDAVDWFAPYANHLQFIGYGNHETNILKRLETDPLRRFVDLYNYTHKPENPICLGGYGGWLTVQFKPNATERKSYTINYFHGSGGGGIVTKGVIQNQRRDAMTEGADCVWMGHVHELYTMVVTKQTLDRNRVPILKDVLHVRTAAYKEEYQDGFGGWHIERGAPPKPVGGVMLELGVTHKCTVYAIPTTITDKTH
jgi:hypothetical protein